LKGLIPSGDVAYQQHQQLGDLSAAIAVAKSEYLHQIAPDPRILAHAIGVIYGPHTVTYVLRKTRILGFDICVGWMVEAHPADRGPATSGFAIESCKSNTFAPPWSTDLPSPMPSVMR